jgi:hypothetical protein
MPDTTVVAQAPSAVADHVLLTMAAEGGRCTYGVCRSELVVQMDGAYTFTEGDEALKNGTLDSADLSELKSQIQATDFAAIKAQPFTGECPTAYDGQEWIFEITTAGGVEELRSCQVQIDPRAAPFGLLIRIWDRARQS